MPYKKRFCRAFAILLVLICAILVSLFITPSSVADNARQQVQSANAEPSPGVVDPSFGNDGQVRIDLGTDNFGYALAFQNDGKIVVGGNSTINNRENIVLIRLNADGSFDTSFGTLGVVKLLVKGTDTNIEDLVIQPDGKILISGVVYNNNDHTIRDTDIILGRYKPDGTPDPDFGTNGLVITDTFHGACCNSFEALTRIAVDTAVGRSIRPRATKRRQDPRCRLSLPWQWL